jgi:uncharacterized protein (TIGR02246 family)
MSKSIMSIFLMLAMATTPVSLIARRTPVRSVSDAKLAEEQVRKLSQEEVEAFLHNDPSVMARLWSDDFVVTNPLNKFVNKQQVLGMVTSGVLVMTSFQRTIEYVRVYGDTVIVAGSEAVVWGGKMPNAGRPERLRFTAVWMKQQGRWQEVARHANILPEQ